MELAYAPTLPGDRPFVIVRPYGGEEGSGYGEGIGTVSGERLKGTARWVNHPRRRSDAAMLPDLHGVIHTEDGAWVTFVLAGRTVSTGGGGLLQVPGERGRQLLAATFEAEHEGYRWLNGAVCVAEGVIDFDTLSMRARMHECIHELE
jgi:hypothetical protein